MEQLEIVENIKIGLAKGYKQNLLLISPYNDFIDDIREYLLTVNVAQQLLGWDKQHNYKIQIEYPVSSFYSNAFPAYDWEFTDIFDMAIISRQPEHSPTKKFHQKIDIAITHESLDNSDKHDRSLIGIELKGINKNESEIIKDAQRLAKAMLLKDKIADNSIKFCFCGFLKRFDKSHEMVTIDYINRKSLEETDLWNKICNDLNTNFEDLNFSINIFEVINTPFEVVSEIHKQMDSEFSEVANDTGIVVGGILTIDRK
ncbi:MAG: hypothetical protein JWQ09_5967 [Segetibacter sp.]|nr:hypothetical protein [Segetibacter sp.]